jgi:hypothetical protein
MPHLPSVISLCAITFLASSSFAVAQSVVSRTEHVNDPGQFIVELIDGELVYDGKLNEEGVAKLIALYRSNAIKPVALAIRSTGGSSYAGMALGRLVFDYQLSVRVVDYCGSSCANYVFTAGRRKSINPGSMIWWHGSMASKSWEIPGTQERHTCRSNDACGAELAAITKQKYRCRSAATCAQETVEVTRFFATEFEPLRRSEREYFELIGVDPSIATYGNDVAACNCVWTFGIADLRNFNVYNVTIDEGRKFPETPESKSTLKEARDRVVSLTVK